MRIYDILGIILRGLQLVKLSLLQMIFSKRGIAIVFLAVFPSILVPSLFVADNALEASRDFLQISIWLYLSVLLPLICLLLASMTINSEFESKTIVQIMVRPFRREEVVFWKYIGVLVTTFMVSVMSTGVLYLLYSIQGKIELKLLGDMICLEGISMIVYGSLFLFINFIMGRPLLWGIFLILFQQMVGIMFFSTSLTLFAIPRHILNIGSELDSRFLQISHFSPILSAQVLGVLTIMSLVLSMLMFRFKDRI